MKRTGFTLIELLAALAIGSMVLTILFNSLFQSIRIVDRADDLVDVTMRATIMQHQLEKDLMGVFIPVQSQTTKEKKDEPQKQTDKDKDKKPETPKPEPDKKKLKPLSKVFYGVNKGNQLDVLTFITNNPMSAYWGKQTGKAHPKIARVVYHLVEDPENKGFFTLMRQEDDNLEYDAYTQTGSKSIRSYELADGIKELSVKYIVMEEKEEPKDTADKKAEPKTTPEKPQEKEKKKEIKFQKVDEWNMEKETELPFGSAQERLKDIKRRIPNVVQITVTLWGGKGERETRFTFNVPILPDLKPIQEQKEPPKKTPQQPGSQTPGKPGQQPTGQQLAAKWPTGQRPTGPCTAERQKLTTQKTEISQLEIEIQKLERLEREDPAALQKLEQLFKEGLQS